METIPSCKGLPLIRGYRQELKKYDLNMRLPPTAEALYLGKLNMDDKILFIMMFIVIKKAIPRIWFRTEVPQVEDCIEIMSKYNVFTDFFFLDWRWIILKLYGKSGWN